MTLVSWLLMTRRWFLVSFLCAISAAFAPAQTKRPKLVVGIVVDQFRYDYLTRFRADYSGGFDRLLKHGAVFTNARYEHYPTVTAAGHAAFMTGATPSLSGIIGNEWYDRGAGQDVTSVSDATVELLGGGAAASQETPGASPHRLLVSTLGDEMKMAWHGKPRVIGISLKDRSAILPAGHMADAAYWFDAQTGGFVSSTFYMHGLPQWVKDFNASRPADHYLSAEWTPLVASAELPAFIRKMPAATGPALYSALESSPFGNELVEAFTERAIANERLGQHDSTDLLTVSFSSNDYVGHAAGPDAPEVRDISIRTDRILGKLFDFLDAKAGRDNVLVVFTADHGVSPLPEVLEREKMPGGRLSEKAIFAVMQAALSQAFGEGRWIASTADSQPYLNDELIVKKKLDKAEVERVAAAAADRLPHVYRVYTREDLLRGCTAEGQVTRDVLHGFFPSRSPDLIILFEPYWIAAAGGTTHGSVFGYDSHVPVIFMGPNVKPGRYHRNVAPNDIAPTLATMLDVETPSGSVGRVLTEMLVTP